jgi:nicotinamide mononucleotide (NMN) deamidase PncC/nicotinic acid mononucleotide adenylyltransferase
MSTRAAELHATDWLGVFYLTGGGASLLAEILNTPGASATVLEASVPYASDALSELLGRTPEQACSATTARQLAMAAYQRAQMLRQGQLFGFGCTASLATNRAKKGVHRAHWAIQTANDTFTFSATYNGDRASEEQLLLEQMWHTLRHCLITHNEPVDDALLEIHARANPELRPLLQAEPYRLCLGESDGHLLLPGSFNPVHDGHREMLTIAEQMTGLHGAFELAVRNADKPSLDYLTIEERLQGIEDTAVWLTNTPTFEGKAMLFPGCTFALGVDTLARIGELRFYQNHVDLLEQAMRTFEAQDSHFLVFGRKVGDAFTTLDDLDIPATLRMRCTSVAEDVYRNDTSSTAIRQSGR